MLETPFLSNAEAVKLRELLRAPFIQQWFAVATANRPSLGLEKTIEGQALKSREAKGWEDALRFLQEIPFQTQEAAPKSDGTIDFSDETK